LCEKLDPKFAYRDGSIFSENYGRMRYTGIVPDPDIIDRLTMAREAPRDSGGAVNRDQLPRLFTNWLKVSWGARHSALPMEGDDTATSAASIEEFRTLIGNLMHAMLPPIDGYQKRYSVGASARCYANFQPGKPVRVSHHPLWGWLTEKGLRIAFLPALAGQVQGQFPEIRDMSLNKLTAKCRSNGIAADGDNRIYDKGEQFRVAILSEEFVKSLALPNADDDALAAALHEGLRDKGKPN
jgi:hypothetical protein